MKSLPLCKRVCKAKISGELFHREASRCNASWNLLPSVTLLILWMCDSSLWCCSDPTALLFPAVR